jgi:replication factor C large subunit
MPIGGELWTQKYAPKSLNEVAGNEDAKEEIRKWALEAERGKKVQPLLIYGAVGVGKSAIAYALAREMGWEIIETNASDLRDALTLKKIYGLAASSVGLFGEKQLILIDEIDSVSDRQEFATLQQIIKDSAKPIMLIANDLWNQKISALRFTCKQVEIRRINLASIRKRLIEISEKESHPIGIKAEDIAKNAGGDIRSALNDLQATIGMENFDPKQFSRDRDENIFEAVRTVLKTMNYSEAIKAGGDYNTQEGEMLLLWLDENIPLEYEKIEEQSQAYQWLSRADVFSGRIRKRQHWGYLKYVAQLGKAGVALSKQGTYHKFVKYQFPSLIRTLGQSRKNRGLLLAIKRKIARKMHISMSDSNLVIAFISALDGFAEYFELDGDEASLVSDLYKHEKHQKGKARK